MNKLISKLEGIGREMPAKVNGRIITVWMLKTAIVLAIASTTFYACKREPQEQGADLPLKHSGKTSAQSLPGGKARFSWVTANFDASGASWERMTNLTFTASSTSAPGTVAATVWLWQSTVLQDKQSYMTHRCTTRGYSKICDVYTPYGWIKPTSSHTTWGGTYTYNTTTGVLAITWTSGPASGSSESWQITNPTSTLARASLISGGYGLTHGRGYGSNAAWSTFKTISQIASAGWPSYTTVNSRQVTASHTCGTCAPTLSAGATSGQWIADARDFTNFTTATSPNPSTGTVAHWDRNSSDSCDPASCSTSRLGRLYHLASLNNSRSMVYNLFCACLPQDGSQYPDGTEFPCYPRRRHSFAVQQIIDDDGAMVGMIALEACHSMPSQGDTFSTLSINDWNNIP